MDRAHSFGGIVMVIAVAVVCATAATRAQPQLPGQLPDDQSLTQEFLASDLIGRPVRSANGEAVGEIADLVLSPADTVTSAVVSVGGFLGIGARRVEVPYDKLVVAANHSTVLVTMSKGQVTAEPEFSSPAKLPNAGEGATAAPPQALTPDSKARTEAAAEAARTFATDDPRVEKGIAENKEAFDGDGAAGTAEPK